MDLRELWSCRDHEIHAPRDSMSPHHLNHVTVEVKARRKIETLVAVHQRPLIVRTEQTVISHLGRNLAASNESGPRPGIIPQEVDETISRGSSDRRFWRQAFDHVHHTQIHNARNLAKRSETRSAKERALPG